MRRGRRCISAIFRTPMDTVGHGVLRTVNPSALNLRRRRLTTTILTTAARSTTATTARTWAYRGWSRTPPWSWQYGIRTLLRKHQGRYHLSAERLARPAHFGNKSRNKRGETDQNPCDVVQRERYALQVDRRSKDRLRSAAVLRRTHGRERTCSIAF